jgi:peptidyl-prolyl cis-trans isomerase B (cyclophilin B)
MLKAILKTNKGNINLELYHEKTPLTVANFVNLSKRSYYDGLIFHRVIPDFMIQGGCPQGIGTGGPGYQFKDEFHSSLRHDSAGILSMANSGPGTNGSQFFITHNETPWLDNNHTVFGAVIADADQDVVDSIKQNDIIESVLIEGDFSFTPEIQSQIDEWNDILS